MNIFFKFLIFKNKEKNNHSDSNIRFFSFPIRAFLCNLKHEKNSSLFNKSSLLALLCAFFFILFSNILISQPTVQWDKTFGGSRWESMNSAFKTDDEGFLLCGSTSSEKGFDVSEVSRGSSDYWVVRIDSLGNKLWDKRYGGDGEDICFKVIQNTEGYLLIGNSRSSPGGDKTTAYKGEWDIWLIQVRPNGTKVWEKSYGGAGKDEVFNALKLSDGSYIISAHSNSPAGGDKTAASNRGGRYGLDLWVLKLDASGNKIWDKTFGGDGDEESPTALTATKDGNFIIAVGSSSGASGDRSESQQGVKDFWIVKISPSGEKLWDKRYGGEGQDVPYDIQELKDETLVIGGFSESSNVGDKESLNYGESDYWLVKIDKNGKKIWDKSYGGASNDYITGIDQNKTGYFLVAGQTVSLASGNKEDSLKSIFDMWILYLDENGKKIWEKTIGGDKNDVPFELVKFRDGSYLICGLSNSNKSFDKSEDNRDRDTIINTTNDFWIVKINCISDMDIGNDTLVCTFEPVKLNAEIPNCRNCLYEWSTGEKTAAITVRPRKTSQYSVKVTFNNACEMKDDVDIIIIPPPDTVTYVVQSPRCRDGKDGVVAIDSIKGGTPPFSLIFNTDTFRQKIFIDKLKPGIYPITLIDKNGCKLNSTVEVPNPTPFNLYMAPSAEIALGDSFRLFAVANRPLDTFFWTNRTIRVLDTIVKPFDSETYSITAIDELGCVKTGVTQVTIRRNNLFYAPTAFSPNGDAVNELYQIYGGKTVISIDNFKIFSRWGEMMYATDRIFPTAENVGWDGRFNGKEVLPAVYVFMAEITYIDGRKERIKGDFTLMK